jgi:hypothetical protein
MLDRMLNEMIALTVLAAAVFTAVTVSPGVARANPDLAAAQQQEDPEKLRREAAEILAAAKRAGQNCIQLADAVKAGDQSAANKLIGQEINIGGYPTKRTAESWTMDSRWGITVTAIKLQGEHNETVRLEDNLCTMWGKLKSVDVKAKTATLEDVELIYVEWIPALHPGEK